jgi:hypothetical protein
MIDAAATVARRFDLTSDVCRLVNKIQKPSIAGISTRLPIRRGGEGILMNYRRNGMVHEIGSEESPPAAPRPAQTRGGETGGNTT